MSNTEDRLEELVKDIVDILTSKLLTRGEGERLRGWQKVQEALEDPVKSRHSRQEVRV